MALGDPYAEVAELKSRLGLPVSNQQHDAELYDALTAASQEIERFTDRQFNAADTATARLYGPNNPGCLCLDDFWTSTGLVVEVDMNGNGTWTEWDAATDYELRPLNRTSYGQVGWPYTEIVALGSKAFPQVWQGERSGRVRVTAKWGWQDVPAPIKQATLILGSKLFQLKDAPLGVAGMNDYGVVRVQDDKLALAKIHPYARHYVEVG